jgi:hypothetical protein
MKLRRRLSNHGPTERDVATLSRHGDDAASGEAGMRRGAVVLEKASNVAAAEWLMKPADDRTLTGPNVASLVPSDFAAYARLLHPAYRKVDHQRFAVRWRDALGTSSEIGPATTWQQIAAGPRVFEEPSEGNLPNPERAVLVDLLGFHTKSALCWFAVWEGYAGLEAEHDVPRAARFEHKELAYLLFSGPITAARLSFVAPPAQQGPNIWWPDDRTWCVKSDIDLTSTYIGGGEACVESILHDSRIEAVRVNPSDPVAYG